MEKMKNTLPPEAPSPAARPFPMLTDLLVLLGIYFVVQLAVALIGVVALLLSGQGYADLDPYVRGRFVCLSNLFAMAVLTGTFYWYRRWRGSRRLGIGYSIGTIRPRLVCAAFVLMMALSVLLGPLFELLPTPVQDVGRGWWAFAAVVVVAPLFEEWICRGYLFGALRTRYGLWRSILLSALFFAILHVQPAAALNAFVMGVILAWLYACTGSLWSPVLLHAAHNAVAYLLLATGHGEESLYELLGSRGWLYGLCYATAALAAVVALLALRSAGQPADGPIGAEPAADAAPANGSAEVPKNGPAEAPAADAPADGPEDSGR